MTTSEKTISLTILLPAGRLPLAIMAKAHEIANENNLGIYLSTAQNLRLLSVPESKLATIKEQLSALGANFKGPGKFPIPRVCVGQGHCKLGIIDTALVSDKILARFADLEKTKPKFKISLSACTLCCAGTKLTDISVMATRNGYEVFVGGRGGANPKIAKRIKRGASEDEMLVAIETLVEFHQQKTGKKQRMFKLLADPEFPFAEV